MEETKETVLYVSSVPLFVDGRFLRGIFLGFFIRPDLILTDNNLIIDNYLNWNFLRIVKPRFVFPLNEVINLDVKETFTRQDITLTFSSGKKLMIRVEFKGPFSAKFIKLLNEAIEKAKPAKQNRFRRSESI